MESKDRLVSYTIFYKKAIKKLGFIVKEEILLKIHFPDASLIF